MCSALKPKRLWRFRPTLTYFPHIIVDFDLKTAMKMGLVKSLVLDKRKEIGALSDAELDFKAYSNNQAAG